MQIPTIAASVLLACNQDPHIQDGKEEYMYVCVGECGLGA